MHRVFVTYHHANDQLYKDALQTLNHQHQIFLDGSVDTGDIDDSRLADERIREIIRDNYLRDTTVTIVLVGTGTWGRKHVDWEIYSSMFDGQRNKKSGIIAVMLPSVDSDFFTAKHEGEKALYQDVTSWTSITDRAEYERRYPRMPARIIDNLLAPKAKISVTTWKRATADVRRLSALIEMAHRDREQCEYDLSRPMRRAND
jgi:Thoeris protein ThsB, TIR-like domain